MRILEAYKLMKSTIYDKIWDSRYLHQGIEMTNP